jgi:hypothetical protein
MVTDMISGQSENKVKGRERRRRSRRKEMKKAAKWM